MSKDQANAVSIGSIKTDRDVIVVGGNVGTLILGRETVDTPPSSPSPPSADRLPETVRQALAHLRRPETCVYLGERYGLTPHSPVCFQFLQRAAPGTEPPTLRHLRESADWLARQVGLTAARHHLAERYSALDHVDDTVASELKRLKTLAPGRYFATGSYSARIQNALGPDLTVIQDDTAATRPLIAGPVQRGQLLMLHGSEQNFQNALVLEHEVDSYSESRPRMSALIRQLLESPWIVLGADKSADATFLRLLHGVCTQLGQYQRPVFVVDPRPEDEVANDWPRIAMRHVWLTPQQFLTLAEAKGDA